MQIRLSRLIYSGIVFLFLLLTTGITVADYVNADLISHFGGPVQNVAVDGNYAYIGQGQDLVVLDITNFSSPSEVGRLITPSTVWSVTISGNYAYVASDDLMIVDISEPSTPTLVGKYDIDGSVDVAGNYAYVAAGDNGLAILDISDPSSPLLIGIYVGQCDNVAISGNYAYVTSGYYNIDPYGELKVIDISDPAAPTLVSRLDAGGWPDDIVVSGNYAYIANGDSGFGIVDISDPAAPVDVGSFYAGDYVYDINVAGNYAYVSVYNGLLIVDISDPAASTLAGSYDIGGPVDVAGNFTYIAAGQNGLLIVDVNDPSSPALMSTYATTVVSNDIAVSGNYAYVADDINGLVIVDISDPEAPTLVGSCDTEYANDIAVAGSYAYISDVTNGLVIMDIANPSSPTITGSYAAYNAQDVDVAGNYVYVADTTHGVEIVNISDPFSPTLTSIYDTDGSAEGIDVAGNYAYIADFDNGLVIVDISDQAAPTLAAGYGTTDYTSSVAVSGNYAYITDVNNGLVIVDITDPHSPTFKGNYNGSGADHIAVSSEYAYITSASHLVIVDISDPATPTFAGSYHTGGWINGVTVSGNYVYVADEYNGLYILQIVPDTRPPESVTNLQETAVGSNWIRWTWENPSDIGFSHVMVYIDGVFATNTSEGFYNSTGLTEGVHTISTKTVDIAGNINTTLVNDSARTATINVELASHFGDLVYDVGVAGNYAYVATSSLVWDGGQLQIVDITDPESPILVGSCDTGNGWLEAWSVEVSGNYAYVISRTEGPGYASSLDIVDISDPSAPILVGRYDSYGYAHDVAISGNYAYVASEYDDFRILDISDPEAPTLTDHYDTGDSRGVAVSGNYAYVVSGAGLVILDISDPSTPTFVGHYDTGYANDVSVAGNYAYVISMADALGYASSLEVVDISDPSKPTLVSSYDTAHATDVAVAGNYVYITEWNNGLMIVDITDPSAPTLAGIYGIGGPVAVAGNHAYIAAGDDGLVVLRVGEEFDTKPPASVTDLGETDVGPTWINWTWTNPTAPDLSHVMIYVNGTFVTNTSGNSVNSYNATGLAEGLTYSIGLHTVDTSGNINSTWVNDSATTRIPADITPPASVTNLGETDTGPTWINWVWTNPTAPDLSHVMIYVNGAFVTNTSGNSINSYNATGLAEGLTYSIGLHTVDTSGNINSTWVNDSATTRIPADITPPASVTDLGETDIGPTWINWTWTNPSDTDFSHVMIYVNGTFVTNTSGNSVNYYNATGLAEGLTYSIGIHTVDISGNINTTWVNDSATTTIPADITPPAFVTDLGETDVGPTWINWTWTNPTAPDFSHVMIYVNGTFVTNTSGNSVNSYNATGLAEGLTYSIGLHTVDTSGNINSTWVNDSATTPIPADITPPAYVTDLGETDTGPTWINWTWTNPSDTDFSHVMIYVNGTFVTNTSGNSVNYYNATGLAEGLTYSIGIHTVDISGNTNSTWVNDSATTVQLPKIFGLSGVNITTSSITLVWEASGDTSRVEIFRDNILIGNVSGATTYADSNLSSSTKYSYTLIPYTVNGLEGKAVSISLTTASPSSGSGGGGGSSTSKTSSGGGGGGAGSAEDFTNVVMKDVDTEYLAMNTNVTYQFTREGNPIQSVSFYSLKNSGQITSTIEVLHNRSKLVKSSPEGLTYNYVNIWVGKSGFATASNIKDAKVRFRVTGSWLQEMGVNPADVKLQRYNGNAWEVLPTTMESNTTSYAIFESQTPGFSPFAITAEKAIVTSVDDETAKGPIMPGDVGVEETQPERSGIWTFMLAILIIGTLAVGYAYLKKRQN